MLLICSFFACKRNNTSEQANNTYFADLYIRYLDGERDLKATATFYKGDSLQDAQVVSLEDGVTFYGRPMEKRNLQNTAVRYLTEVFNTDYTNTYSFSIKDKELGNTQFDMGMTPIGPVAVEGKPSKANGLKLSVAGGRLNDRQSMVFLYSDTNNKAHSITIQGPQPEEQYLIPADSLQEWPVGKGRLYLVKKQLQISQDGFWSVQKQMEYYSKNLDLELLP